jgi:hypothetical protein
MNGEIEKKDTFKNRVLNETPKYVQRKLLENPNIENLV